jgi:hypothetical protein
MSFMEKQVRNFSTWQVETTCGTETVPCDVCNIADIADYIEGTLRESTKDDPDTLKVTGYFGRLSAPGYLDCTEWSGPFDTEKEAKDYLTEMYGDDDESIDAMSIAKEG